MRVALVLGCWGRSHDGFRMCGGVSNEILDLTAPSERNQAMSDFLDSRYALFDRPLYTNVHTALFSLKNEFEGVGAPVFAKGVFELAEQFCVAHARCGLFLRLEMKEEEP